MRDLCDDVKTLLEGKMLEPEYVRPKMWWEVIDDDVRLQEPEKERRQRQRSQNPMARRLRLLHGRYPHDD